MVNIPVTFCTQVEMVFSETSEMNLQENGPFYFQHITDAAVMSVL